MDLGFPIRYLQNRLNGFRLDLHRLRLYRSQSWNYDVEQRIKEYEQAIDILAKANVAKQSESTCNFQDVSGSFSFAKYVNGWYEYADNTDKGDVYNNVVTGRLMTEQQIFDEWLKLNNS